MLLVAFVVLTLIFGSISVFGLFQVGQLKSSSIITVTITTPTMITSTVAETPCSTIYTSTVTTSMPVVPEEGSLVFWGMPSFSYKLVGEDFEPGSSTNFNGVTFASLLLNNTYVGCMVRIVKITFQDGSSEVIQTAMCPTGFEPHIYFADHSNPRAGIIISYGHSPIVEGFYLLVSE